MALEHPPQASDQAPISSASPPSPSPPILPLQPKRQPSFWERTKQSTVGVWDNAYKLGSRREKQNSLEALYPTSLDVESIRAARILRTFTWDAADVSEESLADRRKIQLVLRKIPPEVVSAAKGLVIVNVFRTGSLFSAVNGSGVVLSRLPDGCEFISASATTFELIFISLLRIESSVFSLVFSLWYTSKIGRFSVLSGS